MTSIHHRTITALAMQQRLLGSTMLYPDWPDMDIRKLAARIRITAEAMKDSGKGAFITATKNEMGKQWLHFDPATDSWVKP